MEQFHPTGSGEGPRSPLVGVVKAGSGALVPLMPDPVRIAVALYLPEVTRPNLYPPGTLFAPDVPAPEELRIVNVLVNPLKALNMGILGLGNPSEGTIGFGADMVLRQFQFMLPAACSELDKQPGGAGGYSDRVQARSLLSRIANWVGSARIARSGEPAEQPLTVPGDMYEAAQKLAGLGSRLYFHEVESRLALSRKPPIAALDPMPAASPRSARGRASGNTLRASVAMGLRHLEASNPKGTQEGSPSDPHPHRDRPG